MFVDYRQPEGPEDIRCSVCIVGAGAAGISLAFALADSGMDICVIESGGFEYASDIQSLYQGESVGMETANPMGCRLRYLGGTTNHWQGWCAPLQSVDFAARAWVPNSGWPLERHDLDPYYPRARQLCQVAPTGGEAENMPAPPQFDAKKVEVNFWHFSPPTRFGTAYREQLANAGGVSVFLHCNVYKVDTNAAASAVTALRVRTLEGKTGTVVANAYVLACGGMENTRLLLLTDEVESAGLGNRSGALGKYFSQHIEAVAARILSPDAVAIAETFARHDNGDSSVRAHTTISPLAQQEHGLLNTGFSIDGDYSVGYRALHHVWDDLRSGDWPDELGARIKSVITDLDATTKDLYMRSRHELSYLSLGVKAEQAPNAASTISLSNDRDTFGLRRLRVDWRLSPLDRQSIIGCTQKIAEEFGRLKLGRLQLPDWLSGSDTVWPDHIWSGCHHMGTTRMSHDVQTGIVNPDCRVHSVANLYIAGSSVFPTGGYVPPTLTIVAMALRLGDHLREQYA